MIYCLETKLRDKLGVPCFVVENSEIFGVRFFQKKITKNKFFTKKTSVQLILKAWQGERFMLRDYVVWSIGSPNAYHIVCSPKFKSILENINLPPHRFYPAEIDVLGEVHHYFVLHFIHEYLQLMVYEQSRFCRAELLETEPILQAYKTGEINDFDHYNSINTKLIDDMQWIFPKRIAFRPENHYDVWGLQGQIILSENAKQKIEEAGITGVAMPEMDNGIEVITNTKKPAKTQPYTILNDIEVSVVAEPEVKYGEK